MLRFLDSIPYAILLIAALTLGLAPFSPVPHLVEKLGMLRRGDLRAPIDIFDLLLHATPFILLALKLVRDFVVSRGGS